MNIKDVCNNCCFFYSLRLKNIIRQLYYKISIIGYIIVITPIIYIPFIISSLVFINQICYDIFFVLCIIFITSSFLPYVYKYDIFLQNTTKLQVRHTIKVLGNIMIGLICLSIISLVIFILYIIYDTNKILLKYDNTTQFCITGALDYYLDIINIFIDMLRLSSNN